MVVTDKAARGCFKYFRNSKIQPKQPNIQHSVVVRKTSGIWYHDVMKIKRIHDCLRKEYGVQQLDYPVIITYVTGTECSDDETSTIKPTSLITYVT